MNRPRKKHVFDKPRARKTIEFTSCDEEGWFYDVEHVTKKTQERRLEGMITAKMIDQWTSMYVRKGYSVTTTDI